MAVDAPLERIVLPVSSPPSLEAGRAGHLGTRGPTGPEVRDRRVRLLHGCSLCQISWTSGGRRRRRWQACISTALGAVRAALHAVPPCGTRWWASQTWWTQELSGLPWISQRDEVHFPSPMIWAARWRWRGHCPPRGTQRAVLPRVGCDCNPCRAAGTDGRCRRHQYRQAPPSRSTWGHFYRSHLRRAATTCGGGEPPGYAATGRRKSWNDGSSCRKQREWTEVHSATMKFAGITSKQRHAQTGSNRATMQEGKRRSTYWGSDLNQLSTKVVKIATSPAAGSGGDGYIGHM